MATSHRRAKSTLEISTCFSKILVSLKRNFSNLTKSKLKDKKRKGIIKDLVNKTTIKEINNQSTKLNKRKGIVRI